MKTLALAKGERLFTEQRTASYRHEDFDYIHVGIIDASGEKWTNTELDEINIGQIWEQYRSRHGLPSPSEMSRIRKALGVTVILLATILGMDSERYESIEIGNVMPSKSEMQEISALKSRTRLLCLVEKSKHLISDNEYCELSEKLKSQQD